MIVSDRSRSAVAKFAIRTFEAAPRQFFFLHTTYRPAVLPSRPPMKMTTYADVIPILMLTGIPVGVSFEDGSVAFAPAKN